MEGIVSKVYYEMMAKKIDKNLLVHYEDDYIYFLDPNGKTSVLLQEKQDMIIVWDIACNDNYSHIVKIIQEETGLPLVFPYVETLEEKELVVSLGAVESNLEIDLLENLPKHSYGTFILRNN